MSIKGKYLSACCNAGLLCDSESDDKFDYFYCKKCFLICDLSKKLSCFEKLAVWIRKQCEVNDED